MDQAPIVVVGDALLDVDVVGSADRLAPDSPVPVVRVDGEDARPGGAGLAALLALSLAGGRPVALVAPIVDDADGRRLRALLIDAGVEVVDWVGRGATTAKCRVLAQGGHQVVRLDRGDARPPEPFPARGRRLLDKAAAILVADYGLGATADPGLRAALADRACRLVWDPHPRGTAPVAGADLVTPNEGEARGLVADDGSSPGDHAAALCGLWDVAAVAVTTGSRGAVLGRPSGAPIVVPAALAQTAPRDTCGAGDCFAAAAAVALAERALLPEAVERAVAAAGRFVAQGAASSLDLRAPQRAVPPADPVARVRAEGGTVVATGGCFDLLHAGHVETLRAARAQGDCLVVLLNSDDSVRRLKGPSRPIVPQDDRARVLAALDPVDAVVVFDEDTPIDALRHLRPDVWAKGGDYSADSLPEAKVIEAWGGRTVLLPYLDGRSTTGLVAQAVGSSAG